MLLVTIYQYQIWEATVLFPQEIKRTDQFFPF